MRRVRGPSFGRVVGTCMCLTSAIGTVGPTAAQEPPRAVAILRISGERVTRFNEMLHQALHEVGHEDGRTIRLADYFVENRVEALTDAAQKVAATRPAAIIAIGLPIARAVRAATSSVPIVAMSSSPVENKLVASLSRPGGNLTGVSILTSELDVKRLSLLREFMPSARRIAVLRDPALATADHVARLEATARSIGVTLDIVDASLPDEIAPALRLAKSRGAEAVNVLASPMLNNSARVVAATARDIGLPSVCQWQEMAEAGCLMSYGPSLMESYRLVAKQLDRILRGAKPADLPVEQPTKLELVINLKTAKALGIEMPLSFLARADETIE